MLLLSGVCFVYACVRSVGTRAALLVTGERERVSVLQAPSAHNELTAMCGDPLRSLLARIVF